MKCWVEWCVTSHSEHLLLVTNKIARKRPSSTSSLNQSHSSSSTSWLAAFSAAFACSVAVPMLRFGL